MDDLKVTLFLLVLAINDYQCETADHSDDNYYEDTAVEYQYSETLEEE
jgi:hypothetical protein